MFVYDRFFIKLCFCSYKIENISVLTALILLHKRLH
jgi:hypothetical protein